MSFFAELKRRNVFRVGIAYAVAAWVLLQIIDLVLDNVEAPGWVMDVFMLVVVLGFIVSLIIAWAYEITPQGIKREHEVDRSRSISAETGHKLDRIIIGFLAVAVVLLLADRFEKGSEPFSQQTALENAEHADEKRALTPVKSIAVLPFTNMSDDASNEFFSDGISEEILNALARVKELKVAGRTSAFAFKGRNEDLREIGEALGVNHILEGSVRKVGNKVRITAQLIKVEDGFHMWSDTYDRELTDIFAIQDEIAAAILEQLKAQLMGGEQIASTRADTQAYEKYLLAKQRIYGRTRLEIESAAQLLDEAIALDPGFAPAWAQRGIATLFLSEREYGTIPFEEALESAKEFLEKSLALDENLAEGLAGMGLYFSRQPGVRDAELAVDYLQRALAINPALINASNWLQNDLLQLERVPQARAILENMVERDPLYRPGVGNLSFLYSMTGEPDQAYAILNRARPYMPDDPLMALVEANILNMSGRHGEAYPLVQFAYARDPAGFNSIVQLSLVMLGTNQFEQLAALETPIPSFRLIALAYLGRIEEGTLLAQREADRTGDPSDLIGFLAMTGRYGELVRFLEQRWPDLAQLEAEYKPRFGFGHGNMLNIANAYLQSGNRDKFDLAMALVRQAHDTQNRNGANNKFLHFSEASYWTLANDHDRALSHLQLAVDQGLITTPRISRLSPVFKVLEGDPRYEDLQARALENLNTQRALLDLEPLEMEYSL